MPIKSKKLLAIDPGLNGTGWAAFSGRNLIDAGVITIRNGEAWEVRANMYGESLLSLTDWFVPEIAAIEYPAFFETAAGTMVAKTGDLQKLTYLVGIMSGFLCKICEIKLVPVHEWKGQLPKDVVISRIKKILPEKKLAKIKTHAWDAIGIGLHINGDF